MLTDVNEKTKRCDIDFLSVAPYDRLHLILSISFCANQHLFLLYFSINGRSHKKML